MGLLVTLITLIWLTFDNKKCRCVEEYTVGSVWWREWGQWLKEGSAWIVLKKDFPKGITFHFFTPKIIKKYLCFLFLELYVYYWRYIQRAGDTGSCCRYPGSVKQQELKWAEKGLKRANEALRVMTPEIRGTPTRLSEMSPGTPKFHAWMLFYLFGLCINLYSKNLNLDRNIVQNKWSKKIRWA